MLKVSSGLGKLTLSRSVHFGIFFVVLIECGASSCYPYRLILSFIFFLLFFNRYLFLNLLFLFRFKVMIILAWNGGSPSGIFDPAIFKKLLSIFITASVLKLGQGDMRLCFIRALNLCSGRTKGSMLDCEVFYIPYFYLLFYHIFLETLIFIRSQ